MLNNKIINVKKITALRCDGANIMSGKTSGMAKRSQVINPSLIAVHRLAHRLAFLLQHVIKDIQSVKSYNDSIKKAIFVFFNITAV